MAESDDYEDLIFRLVNGVRDLRPEITEIGTGRKNKLLGVSGVRHQADVSFIDQSLSPPTLVVIECKRHTKRIKLADVKVLKATIEDVLNAEGAPTAAIGILASTMPLQSGTVAYAKFYGIQHELVLDGPNYCFRYDKFVQLSVSVKPQPPNVSANIEVIRRL